MIRLALLGLCGLALAACGDRPTTVSAGGGQAAGTEITVSTPGSAAQAIAPPSGDSVCVVSNDATGPIFDASLQAQYGEIQSGQTRFDWNGDGQDDVLRFKPSSESVIVDHGAGAFEATGVPSDFGDVLYDTPGVELEEAGPDGPPSAEAFSEGLAGPTPAAVGDFTGDGRPDLAVFTSGELVVHASSGRDSTETAIRNFADATSTATSWASPRQDTDLPFDEATVVAVGDINGDGIGDLRVDSYAPRAFVSPAFYFGKPCE